MSFHLNYKATLILKLTLSTYVTIICAEAFSLDIFFNDTILQLLHQGAAFLISTCGLHSGYKKGCY